MKIGLQSRHFRKFILLALGLLFVVFSLQVRRSHHSLTNDLQASIPGEPRIEEEKVETWLSRSSYDTLAVVPVIKNETAAQEKTNETLVPAGQEKKMETLGPSVHHVSNCTGTAAERRSLAALGDAATEENWRDMAKCMRQRESRLKGHYVQHVSKSAGTAVCTLFQNQTCGKLPTYCWQSTPTFSQKPLWLRKSEKEFIPYPSWLYPARQRGSTTCGELVKDLSDSHRLLTMPENFLPDEGVCEHDFLSSIAIRDPIERLQSHYDHLIKECFWKFNKQNETTSPCYKPFIGREDGPHRKYNITLTARYFDIVTDNYLLRSLNNQSGYLQPFGFDGKGEQFFQNSMESLRKFDWILITDSTYEPKAVENDQILMQGLGLTEGLRAVRVSPRHKLTDADPYSFRPDDLRYLKDLNEFDIRIWQEAHRLHALDVESLRRLALYSETLSYVSEKKNNNTVRELCCGHICN